jgi:hypothetical protein
VVRFVIFGTRDCDLSRYHVQYFARLAPSHRTSEAASLIEYLDDGKSSNCPHDTTDTMLSTSRGAALRAITSSPSISIPAFLVPAFQFSSARAFSATNSTQSHIGRAPLSIPPEVNFSVAYPTPPKNARPSPEQLRPTVTVEGPLGSLSMIIPQFVHIEHDAIAKKAFVTVEDREVRKQREMWGMRLFKPVGGATLTLTSRHHKSLPSKPHPRRLRRT